MYLLFKSLHIISFVAWMSGLLYLPRLFVYHAEEKVNSKTYDRFIIMEYRLLKFIMNPAMIFTWIFGLILVSYDINSIITSLWFTLKFLLVLVLSAFHGYLSKCRKHFSYKSNRNSVSIVIRVLDIFVS